LRFLRPSRGPSDLLKLQLPDAAFWQLPRDQKVPRSIAL
jgi:hypothetical protein